MTPSAAAVEPLPRVAVPPEADDVDADDVAVASTGKADWRSEARVLVGEFMERSPALYWLDLVLSAGGAWALTAVYFLAAPWSALQILAFVGAGILFFRAGTFIHEIVHMPARQMLGFKRMWNLLIGVPFLTPWVLYRNHIEHHAHKTFGTPADGEYLPLASSPPLETVKYLAQAPLLPLFMIARFGIIGPLSWLHAGFREWTLTRVSAAVSNPYYKKRFPAKDQTHLLIVEAMCFVWLVVLGIGLWQGVIQPKHVVMAYLLLAFTLGLNWVRNLSAHRYGNAGGNMTAAEQVEDSINIVGQGWLTVLMFPVGLRYHALHHLFPALPYHNMGAAHRRLMERLPADSPYRGTNRSSFFAAVGEMWRAARSTPRDASSMRAWSSFGRS